MLRAINHHWRILATGISFASFGVGGVFLWWLAFPILGLCVKDRARRNVLARGMVQRSFGAFVELMRLLGVLSYELHGVERLQRQGLLVLANHPTLIDVVFVGWLTPNADCVVKAPLARNPFTRGPVQATGYVNNANGPGLIEDCIASVRSGSNLMIFPEGTRSPPGGFGSLQRGAANVAIHGRINVTPVLIRCDPPTLGKGGKWYRVPSRRFHMTIDVRPDIAVEPFLAGNSEPMAARQLTDYLSNFFTTELARARA